MKAQSNDDSFPDKLSIRNKAAYLPYVYYPLLNPTISLKIVIFED
jgi:hypothetical protein